MREYYLQNRDKIRARSRKYRQDNPEKARAAVARCHERYDLTEYRRRYYRDNAEKLRSRSAVRSRRMYLLPCERLKQSKRSKEWRLRNPGRNAKKSREYTARRHQRIPQWLTDDDVWLIREIYDLAYLRSELTGVRHHVDHILPLFGRTVSGLHVPDNLQVIPASINLKKNNKHEPGG